MFKNIKFSYDDLISFMNSHVQYVLEIVYRGVHYIYLYALLLIVPVYTYFYTPPLETRNFYTILNVFWGSLGKTATIGIDFNKIFEHSHSYRELNTLFSGSLAMLILAILIVIRGIPAIRLWIASIGREMYAQTRFGYGKDDYGFYNSSLKGKKVGIIKYLIYKIAVIDADERSPSHIPQVPELGSKYPKQGYYFDYTIRNKKLIGIEIGITNYLSKQEFRHITGISSLIGLYVLSNTLKGIYNIKVPNLYNIPGLNQSITVLDPRYANTIYSILFMTIIVMIILIVMSNIDVRKEYIVNDFYK